jgi:hypothetical protein
MQELDATKVIVVGKRPFYNKQRVGDIPENML